MLSIFCLGRDVFRKSRGLTSNIGETTSEDLSIHIHSGTRKNWVRMAGLQFEKR